MNTHIHFGVPFGSANEGASSQRVEATRALKDHGTPGAPSFANDTWTRLSGRRLTELARSLTATEWAILESVRLVRVATAQQLERLHFKGPSALSNARRSRRTLRRLVSLKLLARVDRSVGGGGRGGSGAWTYGIDAGGQRLLNHSAGRRPRRPNTPTRPFLEHALGTTECYVQAVEAATRGDLELLAFEGEPACWRAFESASGMTTVRPDGFVALGLGSRERRFFIEVDRSTVSAAAIARKLALYRAFYRSGVEQARAGFFPRVLWLTTGDLRRSMIQRLVASEPQDSRRLHLAALLRDSAKFMSGRRAD